MMKVLAVVIVLILFISLLPTSSFAHQSGCHRWHSCPSDSGSYVCGDLGYYSQCPSNYYPKTEPKEESSSKITSPQIPDWVRNNAGWWSNGAITNNDFASGIEFMIRENIIKIPTTSNVQSNENAIIPDWVRNNAGWWSEGLISDEDFTNGIQFLIQQGVIQV